MGMSPSADLFYGYDLGDLSGSDPYVDLRPAWMAELGDDAESHLATCLGWSAESGDYSARFALIKGYPVEMYWYGWLEEASHCVRVKASVQTADDYGSITLKPLAVDPAWDGQLADFMRLMELPVPDGAAPSWHMNCSYG